MDAFKAIREDKLQPKQWVSLTQTDLVHDQFILYGVAGGLLASYMGTIMVLKTLDLRYITDRCVGWNGKRDRKYFRFVFGHGP